MKKSIVIFIFLIVSVACNASQEDSLPASASSVTSDSTQEEMVISTSEATAISEESSSASVVTGSSVIDLYRANCAGCHGLTGEGTDIAPALDSEHVLQMETSELRKVIVSGRPDTAMPAWGDLLTTEQIDHLVAFLQMGEWEQQSETIAESSSSDSNVSQEETVTEVVQKTEEVPSQAFELYNWNCIRCHGPNGLGTPFAPPLNSPELRNRLSGPALTAIITNGLPNTQMPAFGNYLGQENISALVTLIQNWDHISEEQMAQLNTQSQPWQRGPGMMGRGMGHGMGRGMGNGGMMRGRGMRFR